MKKVQVVVDGSLNASLNEKAQTSYVKQIWIADFQILRRLQEYSFQLIEKLRR